VSDVTNYTVESRKEGLRRERGTKSQQGGKGRMEWNGGGGIYYEE